MYQNHTPKTQIAVDSPDFDAPHPSADNGKLKMYKYHSGMPYDGATVSQARLDVGAGMPPGTTQYMPHEDPHTVSYAKRRRSTT